MNVWIWHLWTCSWLFAFHGTPSAAAEVAAVLDEYGWETELTGW